MSFPACVPSFRLLVFPPSLLFAFFSSAALLTLFVRLCSFLFLSLTMFFCDLLRYLVLLCFVLSFILIER